MDSSVIRAHQHAAGARKLGKIGDEALGKSQGGFSTKVHIRVEGHGLPMTVVLTAGHRHEMIAFEALMERGAVAQKQGRPRLRPHRIVGDKAYSNGFVRRYLRRRGVRVTIPRKSDQRRRGTFSEAIYKTRNLVERMYNRFKHFRRLATRYEKRAENYRAMWVLASALLWATFANTT